VAFLFFLALIYFLPAILGRNKRHAGTIFLLNVFLGWTVVGWIVALVWACTPDALPVPVLVGASVCYCNRCGKPQFVGGRYCSGCGSSF